METDTKPQSEAPEERSRLVIRVVFSVAGALIPPPIVRVTARGVDLGREVKRGVSLDDARLSRHHATFHASPNGDLSVVDLASKNGTFVNGARIEREQLVDGDVISAGDTCLVVTEEPPDEPGPIVDGLVGDSAVMRRTRGQLRAIAPTDLTVLMVAETGCGKEVAARALHALSGLRGPLVAVNCAAVPENLFESQLFGHTVGAFTGASAHAGFFRAAVGGTLFLDEVGELPLSVQPKLLRALEERAVTPLGSTRSIACPVRVVAATNRDLRGAVASGGFRADLLARLFEANVSLPPLRARREDLFVLFAHAFGGAPPPMTHSFVEAMLLHAWPFNVRELLAMARDLTATMAKGSRLDLNAFQRRAGTWPRANPPRESESIALRGDTFPVSPEQLRAMLAASGGKVSDVARTVGRSRRQVYRWMRKYGIRVDDFRT